MRSATPLLLALLPALSLAWSSGCSSSQSSSVPDAGTSSSSGGSSGGSGSSSGGGGDGGQSGTFTTYSPAGCEYAYAPNQYATFQQLAYDDTAANSGASSAPERVRLGLGGGVQKGKAGYADPTTTAAFTWETAAYNHSAKVKLGTSESSLTTVQAGYVWTQPKQIGAAANMHEVHVCGLQPGTKYYYQVGGGPTGSETWSATQSFSTVPAGSSGPIQVGVFGDARDVVGVWQTVHERMKEIGVSLMAIPGDVVDIGADEDLYSQWLDSIWKDPNNAGQFLTLGQIMILPIDGNHESDSSESFSNWAIPAAAGDKYNKTYDSFEVGSVHFVMIDDQQISTVSSGSSNAQATAQTTWLDADLAAARADKANHPFIVALSHRGMFSTSNHAGDSDVLNTRGVLAPIYDKYSVDLAMNGHDHEYERSKPLHAGSPASGAPVVGSGTQYIISAGAGADPYAINSSPQSYSSGVQVSFCGGGTACGSSPYIGNYTVFTISPTSLKVTVYGLKPSATSYMDDTVIDTITLTPQ